MRFSLRKLSILYVACPVALFLLSWLKAPWALFFLVVLCLPFVWDWKSDRDRGIEFTKWLGFTALLTLGFALVCGLGGHLYQNTDYEKHNALLNDLLRRPWPVHYPELDSVFGDKTVLTYNLPYYLLPAVGGKLWGWEAAQEIGLVWGFLGILLSVCHFSRFTGVKIFRAGLLFFLLAPLDILGNLLTGSLPVRGENVQWWDKIYSLMGNEGLVSWLPQHSISLWLIAFLLLEEWENPSRRLRFAPYWWVIALMCSPMASVGLVPMMIFLIARDGRSWLKKGKPRLVLLCSGLLGFLFASYYFSSLFRGPHFWLFERTDFRSLIPSLLLGGLLKSGIFVLPALVGARSKANLLNRKMLLVSLLFLWGLVFYQFGQFHDLVTKAAIPLTLFFFVAFVREGASRFQARRRLGFSYFAIVFLLGSLTMIWEWDRVYLSSRAPVDRRQSSLSLVNLGDTGFKSQYLGSGRSFFYRFFGKELPGP